MKLKVTDLLKSGKPLLWDGGMGTQLIERGLTSDTLPEQWNVERADDVREIHAAYYAAGAVAVQSNTFGGHPLKLAGNALDSRAEELNREGVKRVVEARPEGKLAIGDIGPCGSMMPPTGTADPEKVKDGFKRQAFALAEGGADAIHIETMFDIEEIGLALDAAKETGLEVMTSMTFNLTPRGFFTIMGISPEKAVEELEARGATVVGANCSIGPADMVKLAGELKKYAGVPVIVQANAGKPRTEGSDTVYDVGPDEFARCAVEMVNAGADIVGGCCGTTPEFISIMSEMIFGK